MSALGDYVARLDDAIRRLNLAAHLAVRAAGEATTAAAEFGRVCDGADDPAPGDARTACLETATTAHTMATALIEARDRLIAYTRGIRGSYRPPGGLVPPAGTPAPDSAPAVAAAGAGSALRSMADVLANPRLLAGKTPSEVEPILAGTPGWRKEALGRGNHSGQGWVLRHYNDRGNPTGPHLRWHPGGGHHGPEPYWRVIGPHGDLGGLIR